MMSAVRRWLICGRVATLALCVAIVGSFALPCLCVTDKTSSHGACDRGDGGSKVVPSSCCCGGVLPETSETMAKVLPAPTPAPAAATVVPLLFAIVPTVSAAAPAAWSSYTPSGLLVLRI